MQLPVSARIFRRAGGHRWRRCFQPVLRATCETGDEELFENWENWQCEAWLLGQQVLYRSVLMTNLSVSVTPRAINILSASR